MKVTNLSFVAVTVKVHLKSDVIMNSPSESKIHTGSRSFS